MFDYRKSDDFNGIIVIIGFIVLFVILFLLRDSIGLYKERNFIDVKTVPIENVR